MKQKKFIAILTTLAMLLSLGSGVTMLQKVQAAGYNLTNPTIGKNGVTTWDCVYFGNYWQEDTNGDGVADDKDEKQPIKWRVLSVDGDDAFLLADQNLDAKQYNTSFTDVTWETCTLRSWLNGYEASCNVKNIDYSSDNFIDTAFTKAEKRVILQTNVVNEADPKYGTKGGNDTKDQVYLLSIAEASNTTYGFDSTFDISSKTRFSKNTAYTAYMAGGKNRGLTCWLRSLGDGRVDPSRLWFASEVSRRDGHGYCTTPVNLPDGVVRPVLHLNLSSNLWSYAGKVFSDGENRPTVSETPEHSTTPSAISTNSPTATMTENPDALASPSVSPSAPAVGITSPNPALVSTEVPTTTPNIKPTPKLSYTPVVEPTKTPNTNASAVPYSPIPTPTDVQVSSSQSPADTLQPLGSPQPTATFCPDSIGASSPSVATELGVAKSASPKTTVSPSKAPAIIYTLRKGQVIKDVKTKAYYKILSVTATGGKAAYLRTIDKKVKKVTIWDTVTWKGKKFKVTQIGNKAFKDYKKLQKVTIGRNVSVIGKKIFANCKSLKVVILTGPKQKLPKNAFAGCSRKVNIRKQY